MRQEEYSANENWLKSINDHVGARIRLRRKQLSMSQTQLGELLGLTFQQIQKYEHGSNRIGAARLLDMARALSVPLMFFYDDMMAGLAQGNRLAGLAESQESFKDGLNDPQERGETADLVRAFHRITDPRVRNQIVELVRTLQAPGV